MLLLRTTHFNQYLIAKNDIIFSAQLRKKSFLDQIITILAAVIISSIHACFSLGTCFKNLFGCFKKKESVSGINSGRIDQVWYGNKQPLEDILPVNDPNNHSSDDLIQNISASDNGSGQNPPLEDTALVQNDAPIDLHASQDIPIDATQDALINDITLDQSDLQHVNHSSEDPSLNNTMHNDSSSDTSNDSDLNQDIYPVDDLIQDAVISNNDQVDGLIQDAVISNNDQVLEEGRIFRLIDLNANQKLKIFSTFDDGSCAFHSILGINENGILNTPDIAEERKKFCDWLRTMHAIGQFPEAIRMILIDYTMNINEAPELFREKVADLHAQFSEGYDNLSFDEKDIRQELFINDPVVLEAYLTALEMIEISLLQDELIILGEFYNKRVILFQPPWGGIGQYPDCNFPDFVPAENDVYIWYENNHYEKIEILPASLPVDEIDVAN
jgi:hypothetical protein